MRRRLRRQVGSARSVARQGRQAYVVLGGARATDRAGGRRSRHAGPAAAHGRADPLLRAVGEELVLPDRARCLRSSIRPRHASNASPRCGARPGDHDGDVADRQVADPVHGREGQHVGRSPRPRSATCPQPVGHRRVSGVVEHGHAACRRRWSRTVPTNTQVPPAPGSPTAASTSSTDSGCVTHGQQPDRPPRRAPYPALSSAPSPRVRCGDACEPGGRARPSRAPRRSPPPRPASRSPAGRSGATRPRGVPLTSSRSDLQCGGVVVRRHATRQRAAARTTRPTDR